MHYPQLQVYEPSALAAAVVAPAAAVPVPAAAPSAGAAAGVEETALLPAPAAAASGQAVAVFVRSVAAAEGFARAQDLAAVASPSAAAVASHAAAAVAAALGVSLVQQQEMRTLVPHLKKVTAGVAQVDAFCWASVWVAAAAAAVA